MGVPITQDDEVSRCIIYDRFFSGNIHLDSHLFIFGQAGSDGAAHESLILRCLAPDDEDVHRAGCRITERQNTRKGQPPSGPDRRYYCGFRNARVSDLELVGDDYVVTLSNIEEYGEVAHVDVALQISVKGKSARGTRRTAAGLALAEAFGPPIPHICPCDALDAEHPIVRLGVECLTSGLRNRWPTLIIGMPTATPS